MRCWSKKRKPKHTTKPKWKNFILNIKTLTIRCSFSYSKYFEMIAPLFSGNDVNYYEQQHARKYAESSIISNFNINKTLSLIEKTR